MGLCVSEAAGALGKGKRKNSPALAQANLVITRMDVNALPPKSQNQRAPSPPAHVKHKEMSQGARAHQLITTKHPDPCYLLSGEG